MTLLQPRRARFPGVLFLPIEVSAREFDAKLLLAAAAVSRGYQVVIGHKKLVQRFALRAKSPAIYLNKAVVRPGIDKELELIGSRGHHIVAQDEEAGLAHSKFDDFYTDRPSMWDMSGISRYLCWGEDDFHALSKSNGARFPQVQITNTGSARASLWGPLGRTFYDENIQSNGQEFGEYVLVATSLASFNHFLGISGYSKFVTKPSNRMSNAGLQLSNPLIEPEREKFMLFCEAIDALLVQTSSSIVIRPHPDEDPTIWLNKFANNSRVNVISEGDVTSLVLGSVGVLHSSSTVALAAYGNVPQLVSLVLPETELNLADWISKPTSNPQEAAAILNRKNFDYVTDEKTLAIHSRVGERGSVGNVWKILEAISCLTDDYGPIPRIPLGLRLLALSHQARQLFVRRLPRAILHYFGSLSPRKRPLMSALEFDRKLSAAYRALGISLSIRIDTAGGALFMISPDQFISRRPEH